MTVISLPPTHRVLSSIRCDVGSQLNTVSYSPTSSVLVCIVNSHRGCCSKVEQEIRTSALKPEQRRGSGGAQARARARVTLDRNPSSVTFNMECSHGMHSPCNLQDLLSDTQGGPNQTRPLVAKLTATNAADPCFPKQ